MSTRCTVIDGGPFHLFEEANDNMRLTLQIHGMENKYSGGMYIDKADLIQFAKQILHFELVGEELPWIYEKTSDE